MSTRKPKALAKVYAERKVVKEIGTVKCVWGGGLLLSAGDVAPGQDPAQISFQLLKGESTVVSTHQSCR